MFVDARGGGFFRLATIYEITGIARDLVDDFFPSKIAYRICRVYKLRLTPFMLGIYFENARKLTFRETKLAASGPYSKELKQIAARQLTKERNDNTFITFSETTVRAGQLSDVGVGALADGNRLILVPENFYSKCCEAVPIPYADVIALIKARFSELICRYDMPEQIHSDLEVQFESRLIEELCELFYIRNSPSTS
ncbi:unnamed protein product [Schistocephalus solidus]|uniref:RES domain-containing protein n=1 Tax=Schistocephalus solidus TaxID=70667 RepID=A0A183SJ66_SCHSO|nr:unnamed protein product [Schistocephalus solidus]